MNAAPAHPQAIPESNHAATMVAAERLHGLDAIRGVALLLGLVLHAAMSFLPSAKYFWIVADQDRTAALGALFYTIHIFRMPLFFLIAGFFAHMAFHRMGAVGFIKDRLRRVAVPLVVGWPIILTAIVMISAMAAMLASGGPLPKNPPPRPAFTVGDFPLFPLTHLWFLYMLLLLYTAMLTLRALFSADGMLNLLHRLAMRMMPIITSRPGPLLLALPVGLALYMTPYWAMWFGVPTPDRSLYPGMAAWVSFGMAFSVGWVLHRHRECLSQWHKNWRWHLGVAVVMTIACLVVLGAKPVLAPAPQDATKLAYAFAYALAAWSYTFAFVGMGLRFFSSYSPLRRYLADASYWVYLVHLPIVMLLQVLVARNDWRWFFKFPLVVMLTMAIALITYHLFVRNSFIGATLNGRRKTAAARAVTALQQTPVSLPVSPAGKAG